MQIGCVENEYFCCWVKKKFSYTDNQDYKKSEVTIQPSGLMFNWEDTSNYIKTKYNHLLIEAKREQNISEDIKEL